MRAVTCTGADGTGRRGTKMPEPINNISDEDAESRIRLDAAIALLSLSSARLKNVIYSGPEEAVEAAYAALRVARVRFLAARADYREERLRTHSLQSDGP